jgi:hypothetical protein
MAPLASVVVSTRSRVVGSGLQDETGSLLLTTTKRPRISTAVEIFVQNGPAAKGRVLSMQLTDT